MESFNGQVGEFFVIEVCVGCIVNVGVVGDGDYVVESWY